MLRRHLYLDALLGREPNFPSDGGSGAVQVLLAAVFAQRELHQHALGQATVQIELHHRAPGALQHDAATPALHRVGGQVGNGLHLAGQKVFHPSGAGQKYV